MESLEETLRRLEQERDEADRRYNDALTALDRALPRPGDWPSPQPAVDDSSSRRSTRPGTSLPPRRRPAGMAWAPRRFHLAHGRALPAAADLLQFAARRSPQPQRGAARRSASTARRRRPRAFGTSSAGWRSSTRGLMVYLQQITAYVDTRDRRAAGGALVLNASLSGLAENVDKRWESLAVRDERADARAAVARRTATTSCARCSASRSRRR